MFLHKKVSYTENYLFRTIMLSNSILPKARYMRHSRDFDIIKKYHLESPLQWCLFNMLEPMFFHQSTNPAAKEG